MTAEVAKVYSNNHLCMQRVWLTVGPPVQTQSQSRHWCAVNISSGCHLHNSKQSSLERAHAIHVEITPGADLTRQWMAACCSPFSLQLIILITPVLEVELLEMEKSLKLNKEGATASQPCKICIWIHLFSIALTLFLLFTLLICCVSLSWKEVIAIPSRRKKWAQWQADSCDYNP